MKYFSLYRIIVIVAMSAKFFWQIYWFNKRHRGNSERFEQLMRAQARTYKQRALQLEGLMIKFGQFLATRADILPKVFLQELGELVDRVPPVPWKEAKVIIENDWNGPLDQHVKWIKEEAVASASIGSVYEAELLNGDHVAIKVQRPRIETIIAADFKALRIVMWMAEKWTKWGQSMDLPRLYAETKTTMLNELNFIKELQNGEYFAQKYSATNEFYIPRYYREETTRRVLVMEWIEGTKISDITFLEKHQLDRHDIAKRLMKGFLEQVLKEGKFHADPHPGNILIRADGTIVLIDFGMIGELKGSDAKSIRRLISAVLTAQYDEAIEALAELRFLLPTADKAVMAQVLKLMFETLINEDFSQMDEQFMEELFVEMQNLVKENPIQLPSEFAFLGRAVSTLVGLLYILAPNMDLMEVGKPIVLEWIANNDEGETKSPFNALSLVQQWLAPIRSLPSQVKTYLEEPTKLREFHEQQAKDERHFAHLKQSRLIAFSFLALSLSALFIAAFFDKWLLVYSASPIAVLSLYFAYRSSKQLAKHL